MAIPTTAVLAGSTLLFALWTAVSVFRQYLRLRHIRGPRLAGFSQWWLVRRVGGGRTHLDLYEVCEKYGDIARVGPNDLITSDPDLMKRMLNVRTTYKRSEWYDGMRLDPAKDNVLSMRNDELHGKLRSKMAAGYSGKEVDNLEAKIDTNVLALLNLLETKYIDLNKAFDFGRKAQYFTLDVISDLAFGTPFGDVASDSDVYEYIQTMEDNMPTIIVTSSFPWLVAMIQHPLFKFLHPSEKDLIGLGRTMAIAKEVAAERFGPDRKVRRDMLGSFVAKGLTQSEVESEILMQILAGSDTTATAIRATLLHIITAPRVVARLLEEISAARPSKPIITDAEARAMPYLQAVIKEGLRIFPPVVGLMSKEVPAGGDTFKGVFLPEGTKIGYCAWGIFRREDVWGKDSHEFRPERWLEADQETLQNMEGTLDLVFGYGRWQCLGRNVALMELNKVFVELVRRYDLSLVDPTKPWHSINAGVFLQSDYWIRGYRRDFQGLKA
ncbi:pisatin demethylase [Verticillium alfalfae VaMs.102]|uniref:Pisatin demethylase n=1 Tax=Verticillium alfalfae (strain VaMs.102 / ATCC MYA-4576 / FGSC 10136) TaxID=526221 RepID=C9SND5_VERA1|nr:pisatin demethylase [Verticillium alfalfae VaMs.102]EEY20300.1 pisatin demethylase [Verticillium alfalfae VaMs.102]